MYIFWSTGLPPCDYFQETNNAPEDEERGVVDEEKALASGLQTKGSTVRAPEVGRNARGGRE